MNWCTGAGAGGGAEKHRFRIMSMQPPVITEGFPDDSKAEHEVTINWDRFKELGTPGNNNRVTFYLDHPKCQQTMAMVNMPITPPLPQ